MAKFRIMPHSRLQEWVAEEQGYFKDEGLDYEFIFSPLVGHSVNPSVESAEGRPAEFKSGAFESMQNEDSCDIRSACHWAVNMAASGDNGRMWGHAYSVTPSAIWSAPDSDIREPSDLANVEVAVGYHSGSHFSALQALESVLPAEDIKLSFVGGPIDRLQLMLDKRVPAANVFGTPYYVLEQQGYRRVLDTTFMIGFFIHGTPADEDLQRYFRALQRAQSDIDVEPERFKHCLMNELPERYHGLLDYRRCGTGERLIFEEYTREVFERTHRWMLLHDLFEQDGALAASYEVAIAK